MGSQSNHTTAAATAISPNVQSDHEFRWANYCEENVWRLAYRKLHERKDNEDYFVVFISNAHKSVLMLHQRASVSPDDIPCCWDYHVILLGVNTMRNSERAVPVVYDVDTTITPYPVSLPIYLAASFFEQFPLSLAPRFRLISAEAYLRYFASDRSHMYDSVTKSGMHHRLPYQCILPNEEMRHKRDAPVESNLQHYLNFATENKTPNELPAEALGVMLTLQQLRSYNFY